MVGLAGESQNFDGNGSYVRFQTGGGAQHRRARHGRARRPASWSATARRAGLGVRPKYPGKRPPYNPSVPCYKSKIPNVNGPCGAPSGPGEGDAVRIAIRKHWLDFVAILGADPDRGRRRGRASSPTSG